MTNELPPFPGFRTEAFEFLRQLANNNKRDWFKPRKSTYDDEIVWPMHCLLSELSHEMAARNLPLTAEPKKAMFRIYRDTRFSKNKDPYKTAAGAVLSRDGTHKSYGGIYIHLEPDNCFLAAGFWNPENDKLRAWRNYMVEHDQAFLEMEAQVKKAKIPLKQHGEGLKRLPRGYEEYADSDIADFLKWKSFIVTREVADKKLQKPAFASGVVKFIEEAYPLLNFGWQTT